MRIIAGTARGIRLGPVPNGVRPTSDRVREAVFNSLGQFFDGGEVLDLYAGTGALGIEALSRGCERAVYVENNNRAAGVVRENLVRAGFAERGEVLRGGVEGELERLVASGRKFHLIFADPPYRIPPKEIGGVVESLAALLSPGGRAVIESAHPPVWDTNIMKGESRRYGGTFVTFLERSEEHSVKLAICPGSFDPITVGHVDVINRAAHIYDHVIVAVGKNVRKGPRLTVEERARLIGKVTGLMENVSVEIMDGLLVEFARERGATVVIKGLRAGSDFESEFQQSQLNRTLYPEFETVFIMAAAEHSFLSSSAVREIASYGGSVHGLVPDEILDIVQRLYVDGQAEKSHKG